MTDAEILEELKDALDFAISSAKEDLGEFEDLSEIPETAAAQGAYLGLLVIREEFEILLGLRVE